jgi:hypothetical protein
MLKEQWNLDGWKYMGAGLIVGTTFAYLAPSTFTLRALPVADVL